MALSLQCYADSNFRIIKERIKKEEERETRDEIKIGHLFLEDLVIEILSWMPVKDLLQFKTVCKSWHAIISSHDFISKHLKNYYNNNDRRGGCLLANCLVNHAELNLNALLVDETPKVLASEVLRKIPMYSSLIDGPCDGIYHLFFYHCHYHALWNPTLNEFRILPPMCTKSELPSYITYEHSGVYGFGVDPLTQDYKVVVINDYTTITDEDERDFNCTLSVLIYSLRTDSWSYWGDLPRYYDLMRNKCYIYVNGCFYWLGSFTYYHNSLDVIISFDLTIDAYKEINLPKYGHPNSEVCLGIYDEAIAFYTVHRIEKRLDIWTLNEGIWTKKFSKGSLEVWGPVGHWKNNKVVLQYDGKLFLCDPHTDEIKDLELPRRFHSCEGVYTYMESLVSIKDRTRWAVDEEAVRARDERSAYLAREWEEEKEKAREENREICHKLDEIVEDIGSFFIF